MFDEIILRICEILSLLYPLAINNERIGAITNSGPGKKIQLNFDKENYFVSQIL